MVVVHIITAILALLVTKLKIKDMLRSYTPIPI